MSETYIPTPETQKPTPEQPEQDDFAVIQEMQNDERYRQEAAASAQRIIDQSAAEAVAPEEASKGWSKRAVAGTAAVASLAGLGGGFVIADNIVPHEVVATAEATVGQGEGIEMAVDDAIGQLEAKGVDPADTTERQDVIYQAVEIHTDENGIVHPGENVEVVAKKSPIFGNITYEAAPDESQDDVAR